jgi:type II secretory pathway pseudopilin PulG
MWSSLLIFILGYTGVISVVAGIFTYEALTRTPLPAETKWSLYTAAILAISFSNWRREVRRADAAEAALAAEKQQARTHRVFVENPQALVERYSHTGTSAERLLIPYLDKWITVSGRFEGFAESLTGDAIHVSLTSERGRRIHLQFPIQSQDRLQPLRPGQQLTAVCQVKHGYGAGVFKLENSELVRVEPIRPVLARAS